MFDPIQRRQYGLMALFLSMILFAVAVAAFVGNTVNRQSVASQKTAAGQECENRLKTLGAGQVLVTTEQVKATWPLEGGYQALSSASAAALACPGWVMSEFCMGAGCRTSGASLTLRRASSADGDS